MYRIDADGSVASRPTPAALGTEGFWDNPDAGSGIDGTLIDADWLNMLQESIIAVLTFGGIGRSKSDPTRLRQAISARIAAFAVPLSSIISNGAQPGYIEIPIFSGGNWKAQWGFTTFSAAGGTNVSQAIVYPIAFTSFCAYCGGIALNNSNSVHGYPPSISGASGPGTTGTTLIADNLSGANASPVVWDTDVVARWLAVGK
jgi:hypothetical protein